MRDYNRLQLKLRKSDQESLVQILRSGVQQVRDVGRRYLEAGLDRTLYDRPRPGAKPLLNPGERQRIIAMVCSDPPEGQARWTVRLIVEEAIKRRLEWSLPSP